MEDKGEPITSVDYLIAGAARRLDTPILTDDTHFGRVSGITVETY